MSTDTAFLSALAEVTGQELRYFELCSLLIVGKQRTFFLCIGKHALYFVKKDLSGVAKGGELFFAHVDSVVVDTNSASDLMLVLNANRPDQEVWRSPKA